MSYPKMSIHDKITKPAYTFYRERPLITVL